MRATKDEDKPKGPILIFQTAPVDVDLRGNYLLDGLTVHHILRRPCPIHRNQDEDMDYVHESVGSSTGNVLVAHSRVKSESLLWHGFNVMKRAVRVTRYHSSAIKSTGMAGWTNKKRGSTFEAQYDTSPPSEHSLPTSSIPSDASSHFSRYSPPLPASVLHPTSVGSGRYPSGTNPSRTPQLI